MLNGSHAAFNIKSSLAFLSINLLEASTKDAKYIKKAEDLDLNKI